jgi:hypothetical protein
MGVRRANQAVSGCNILILPVDASVLRPFSAGQLEAGTALIRRLYRLA